MATRTVLNEQYKGLLVQMSIPADIKERNGRKVASFGSVVPIHVLSPEEITVRAATTHHYCDIFTDEILAPVEELVYVRVDEKTAEKVFINRMKRILLLSADGKLALWRCAATFESTNLYVAGAPIVNKDGALVSVVTAKKGNHYAVSCFEGDGGYFETSESWAEIHPPEGSLVYGDRHFSTREELHKYLEDLPPVSVTGDSLPRPVLHHSPTPRLCLIDRNGRQLSHSYLHGVAVDVTYL